MKPITTAGIVLGLGLGGFVDGIVFHQILGWHHLICTTDTCQVDTVEALTWQSTQDGYFHLATWCLTVVGIGLLFRAARNNAQVWAGRSLFGAALAGWGAFNVVEGLIDHHLLQIHHVRPGHDYQALYDWAFLFSGAFLIVIGVGLVRSAQRAIAALTRAPAAAVH